MAQINCNPEFFISQIQIHQMLTKKMFLNPTCQLEITVYVKDHGKNIFQVGI
jgi:hypothetical protein